MMITQIRAKRLSLRAPLTKGKLRGEAIPFLRLLRRCAPRNDGMRRDNALKIKPLFLIIFLTVLTLSNTCAWGQEVRLVINELKVFPVYKLERVAIGDPAIADITVLSEREIMLIAKKAGATSLIIWDESGQRSFTIAVIGTDLEKTAQRIRGLFGSSDIEGVKVKVEGDNIYAIAEVLTEYELKKIKDILTPFANVVNLVKIKDRQPLIEIDVSVLEVGLNDTKKLGLDWSNSLPVTYSEATGSGIDGKAPKLWKVFRWDRTGVTAKLNFLIQENKARTLANPKLVTLSGKEASFLVGGEVPYITVETEGRTSVQWKNYGVNLKINPEVNSKNEIKIRLEAEVSDLDATNAVTQSGYNIPAIKTRKAESELFLNEGDTIFLAGLIKNDDSQDIDRLPWLGKVPILGELFKSTEFKDKRTELVISLTPKIIGDKPSSEYIAREMDKQEAAIGAGGGFAPYTEEVFPLAYYSQMIEDIIAHSVVYPAGAKEANLGGTVKIALRLSSDGRLREARIKESSGFSALDEAALGAVQGAVPYPSFPPHMEQKELYLTVPVVFKSYVKNE